MDAAPENSVQRAGEVFVAFLKLGCTSFGGPIAHLGYFRHELVERRRWLDDHVYGEVVALCQFLPGPASSQVGFALGLMRAGPLGGLAAWTAFTLPSAVLMFAFALVAADLSGPLAEAAVHGLKIAAVAVVAQALVGMARALTPDMPRIAMAIGAAAAMMLVAVPAAQIALIALGALVGLAICPPGEAKSQEAAGWMPAKRAGLICLGLFGLLLLVLSLAPAGTILSLAAIFYRAGALVFGGGHVVLPLLRAGLVPTWMDDSQFLSGYGAAQAVPGPLFTLSAYLGATAVPRAALGGAAVALLMIFLPGLLLIAGALPFRSAVAHSPRVRAAIAGINATVVGILAAALYSPVWTTSVHSFVDAAIAATGFLLLVLLRAPPLFIVGGTLVAAVIESHFGLSG